MYYGMERLLNKDKKIIDNTHTSVNNIYLNGVRVASVSSFGETQYYLTDQVDSVKLVISEKPYEKPVVANRFEYLPYGETWITEGDGNNNPKYNSQELDKETNFYFYNARHYDPEIARFVTADTVIDGEYSVKGWNRYMYVAGNPIRYKDPTGHWGWFMSGEGNGGSGDSPASLVHERVDAVRKKVVSKIEKSYKKQREKTLKKIIKGRHFLNKAQNYVESIGDNSITRMTSKGISKLNTTLGYAQNYFSNMASDKPGKGYNGLHNSYLKDEPVNIGTIKNPISATSSFHKGKHIKFRHTGDWETVRENTIGTGDRHAAQYKPHIHNQKLEIKAWKEGTPVISGNSTQYKVYLHDEIVGASDGKDTKYLRVEMGSTPQKPIHGHPITAERAKNYFSKVKKAKKKKRR